MARALKLKLDELVFTFDLDMEEFGPEVVDVTGPHLFRDGEHRRSLSSDKIEFLEAQVERAIRKIEEDDDDDDDDSF